MMEKQLTSASLKIKGSEEDGVHVVFLSDPNRAHMRCDFAST
jgi:hypothetical protein